MRLYKCTKIVEAEPMTRFEAIKHNLVRDNNLSLIDEEGYFVIYQDGYESWSPKQAFDEGYIALETEDTVDVTDDITDTSVDENPNADINVEDTEAEVNQEDITTSTDTEDETTTSAEAGK